MRLASIALGVLLATASPGAVRAEELPRVAIEVSPRECRLGDALDVTLQVWTDTASTAERPEVGPVGAFTFRSISWTGPEEADGARKWVWKATVAAFETGELQVPSIPISISGPQGSSVLRTDPLDIRVSSTLADASEQDTELAEIKGPASMPPAYGALVAALAILGGLLAVSAVAWWLQRRLAHRLAAVATPDDPFHRMPPHEWVYRELQQLLALRLAEQGEVDRFFAELSRILKRYLGGRFRVDLMERTTAEVPEALRQAGAPREAIGLTREILEASDRVKFAAERPTPERCREAVEVVYRIVDATKPAEEKGAA